MLLDAEPEVAVIGEVAPLQLVLLHLEAPLQDLLGLGPPDGAVDGDLLVPPDAEAPDGVPRLGEDGGLPGEGLQHLAGAGQSVTGLSHADVQAQLPDLQLPHGVLGLVSAHSGSEKVMFQQQWSHIASVLDDLNKTRGFNNYSLNCGNKIINARRITKIFHFCHIHVQGPVSINTLVDIYSSHI